MELKICRKEFNLSQIKFDLGEIISTCLELNSTYLEIIRDSCK